MNFLIVAIVLLIAGYTMLSGIQNYKERNYLGFIAISALSLTVVILPLYVLFFI